MNNDKDDNNDNNDNNDNDGTMAVADTDEDFAATIKQYLSGQWQIKQYLSWQWVNDRLNNICHGNDTIVVINHDWQDVSNI